MYILLLFAFVGVENAPLMAVDNPLPQILEHGEYMITFRLEPDYLMVSKIKFGLWDRISLGIGCGLTGIVGYGDINITQPWPWVDLRMMIYDNERFTTILGYDNEPYGDSVPKDVYLLSGYHSELAFGYFTTSIGFNYSTSKEGLDVFSSNYIFIRESFSLFLDYTLGSNAPYGNNYVDVGFREMFGPFGVEVDLLNLFLSPPHNEGIGRQVKIIYREHF